MKKITQVLAQLEMPDGRLSEFLQVIRDFEQRDPQRIHFRLAINAPRLTAAQVLTLFQNVQPPLPEEIIMPFDGPVQ